MSKTKTLDQLIYLLCDMRDEFSGHLPVRINVRRTKTKSVALKVDGVGCRVLPEVSSDPDGTILITCSLIKHPSASSRKSHEQDQN